MLKIQIDIALNTLQPHPDYVGIICTKSVCTLFDQTLLVKSNLY